MAYIPRTTMSDRRAYLASGTGGGAESSGLPLASPPPSNQSPAGGQFAGLRAFFAANQPNAQGLATELASGADKAAQNAIGLARSSATTNERYGGVQAAANAVAARDDARRQLDALGSQAGIASLLEQRDPGATYTAGMKNADAALLGRTTALDDVRNRWSGTLAALNPTYIPYVPSESTPVTKPPGSPKPNTDHSGGTPGDWEWQDLGRRQNGRTY